MGRWKLEVTAGLFLLLGCKTWLGLAVSARGGRQLRANGTHQKANRFYPSFTPWRPTSAALDNTTLEKFRSSEAQPRRALQALWGRYMRCLDKRPYLTKSLTA